jgi:hypothetical protein
MTTGTFGLGISGPRTDASGGETLLGLGSAQKRTAMQMLGSAAEQEAKRNMANKQLEQEQKAGTMSAAVSGATTGGMAFGPWGALAGGLLGAIASKSF